jgi:hypothetical protein
VEISQKVKYLSLKKCVMFLRMATVVVFLTVFTRLYSQSSDPAIAAKDWWTAVTFGDTAYVQKHSTQSLAVTFSNGRSFMRNEFIMEVAKYNPGAKIGMNWSEEIVQHTTAQTAVVKHKLIERIGIGTNPLRLITILVANGQGWKIAAAQSTKEIELSPRIPLEQAGRLEDFVGSYRTLTGALLQVVIKNNALILIEPSGAEAHLEAIGPGVFEPPTLHASGNVRIVFSRDSEGSVIALNRIGNKIVTLPKIK